MFITAIKIYENAKVSKVSFALKLFIESFHLKFQKYKF